jgi:hypothetical protein
MKNNTIEGFQSTVANLPTRHKSILDILTKLQDSNSRVNRAVVKSATSCGCISIVADRQEYPEGLTFDRMNELLDDHVDGKLCGNCRNALIKELGNHLFYLTKLANTFELKLDDVLLKEIDTLSVLGKFSLR